MRFLVFGASGRTGRELVRQGLERGHAVGAFVRRPAQWAAKPDLFMLRELESPAFLKGTPRVLH